MVVYRHTDIGEPVPKHTHARILNETSKTQIGHIPQLLEGPLVRFRVCSCSGLAGNPASNVTSFLSQATHSSKTHLRLAGGRNKELLQLAAAGQMSAAQMPPQTRQAMKAVIPTRRRPPDLTRSHDLQGTNRHAKQRRTRATGQTHSWWLMLSDDRHRLDPTSLLISTCIRQHAFSKSNQLHTITPTV